MTDPNLAEQARRKFYYAEDENANPCLFWINPWSGKPEALAMFYWPTHAPEKTRLIEEFYDDMGAKCAAAAEKSWAEMNRMEEA